MIHEVSDAIDRINEFVRCGDFDGLDSYLASVDVSKESLHVLIALIRGSSPLRSRLPAWPKLLTKIRDEINVRDRDANKLLRGLF